MNTSDKIELLLVIEKLSFYSQSVVRVEAANGKLQTQSISVIDASKFLENLQIQLVLLEEQELEELNRELDVVSFDKGIDGRTCCGGGCG